MSSVMENKIQVELGDGVGMNLMRICKDEFLMGQRELDSDEEPAHRVALTNDFYLGVYPVTQEQFAVFTKKTGREHENHFKGKKTHPAESMSWDDAVAFCEWLNKQTESGIPKGYIADLPTEAEWEYACRAGTTTEYYSGDGEGALQGAGWFEGNSSQSTHPVGELQSNGSGLYDMHGNVDEWCLDAWDADAYKNRVNGVEDPVFWPEEKEGDRLDRVIRGGSWNDTAWWCRSAFRNRWAPVYRIGLQGFRLGLFPGPLRARQKAESDALDAEPRDEAKGKRGRRSPAG